MRTTILIAVTVFAVSAWSCGGSNSTSTPVSPTPSGGGGGAATTISIVGNRANQSFSPNPAVAPQGTTMAFTNNDGLTHHLMAVDGSFDTGNIAPGGSSPVLTVATDGANYYCTIHPTMVGSIKASSGAAPPCNGLYCGDR